MMSWKALPLIAIAGVIALILVAVQMRRNRQDVLFNSVGYALEQLHRDIASTNGVTEEAAFRLEDWRPYLKAAPAGRLPGFVATTDVLIATFPQGQTNRPKYLVAVRLNDALACGLQPNGKCARITDTELADWPHTVLAP